MFRSLESRDEFEIIDSHIHLFSTPRRCTQLNWLHDNHALNKPHTYQDYRVSPSPATSAIFVECDTAVSPNFSSHYEEFEDAMSEAAVVAIVAWAPMNDRDQLVDYLRKIRALDTRDLLRGVRVLLQDKEHRYCLQPEFVSCVSHLGECGLLFEIGIDVRDRGTRQLQDALILIQKCPGTTFVIDHLAKPDLSGDEIADEYRDLMSRVASHPNVSMKLSGGLTQLHNGDTLPHDLLDKYIAFNLNVFGSDRLLFGSDWPVLSASSASTTVDKTPKGWYRCCKKVLHDLEMGPEELQKIFARNSKRIYRLTAR